MEAFFLLILLMFFYAVFWYGVALFKRDNSVVDIAWGLGGAMLAVVSFLMWNQTGRGVGLVATVLVVIWGLRLAVHIGRRNWGRGEDFRYAAWRKEWGGEKSLSWYFLVRSFLQVFLFQAGLLLLVVAPVWLVNAFDYTMWRELGALSWVGIGVWGGGFFFEVVGDWQLDRFVARKKKGLEKKDAIMKSGLWSLTRHPNYFGEVMMWWGIFLVCLPVLNVDPIGWLAVISPILMHFLIVRVSGIPMLEKKYEGRAEYEEYKKRVNAFWPWFN